MQYRGIAMGTGEHKYNLSDGGPDAHRIQGFGPQTFTVDHVRLTGAIVLAGGQALQWHQHGDAPVTPASLSVFTVLKPRTDVLVIGTGATTKRVPPDVVDFCRQHGIALEAMDTRRACATYNFLVEEGRVVGAALLPVAW